MTLTGECNENDGTKTPTFLFFTVSFQKFTTKYWLKKFYEVWTIALAIMNILRN